MLTPLLLLSLAAGAAQAPAPDTTVHLVWMGGRQAGVQQGWREPDGEWRFRFRYDDRGRGPRLETRVRLDARGLPVTLETTGTDYYGKPVNESYAVRDGHAAWSGGAGRGEGPAAGAWYAAVNDAMDVGVLARALLAAPGRALPLLPEGRASLDSVGSLRITAGGETREVAQFLVSGFGFEPHALWLNPDRTLFGLGSEWFALLPEGWETALPALIRAQEAAAALRRAELARTLPHRPDGPVVFRGASVFDSESARLLPGTTVVVGGNRIRAVGPDGQVEVPAGATVVDAAGNTLLPGMWDMHTHPGPTDGLLHLAAGVTTIRDLGNDTTASLRLRREWGEGAAVGPRVLAAGFVDGSGPFTGPIGWRVDDAEGARAAVRRMDELGFEQVKVYSSLAPELVPVVVDEAHRRGLRVSGHVPRGMSAADAVRAGLDELQHANFLFLQFLAGDTLDTRTPARFTAVAGHGAELDLASDSVRAFVRLLRERGVVVDPTLAVFEGMFVARPGEVSPGFVAVAERLPATVRQHLLAGGLPVPEGMDRRYRDSHSAMLRLVALLHREGVTLVPGTDALAGFAYHRELELYHQAGIPAAEVLRLATLVPARVTGRDAELGSIAPGKLADLVLVEGNPVERISDVRRTRLVMKDGVLYRPDELYAAVGVGAPAP